MAKFLIPLIFVIFIVITIFVVVTKAESLEPGNHYFTADWCKYCKQQNIIIDDLQNQGFNIQIHNQEIDLEIFKDAKIRELPTIIITNDQIYIRLEGRQSIKKLIEVLIKDNNYNLIQ